MEDDEDADQDDALLLLHGPHGAGQTSLLLQYGFSRAKAGHAVVMVLHSDGSGQRNPRPAIVPLTPCASCGLPNKTGGDNDVWRRIQIKYFSTSAELQHFVYALQLTQPTPAVLLIDAIDRYFPDGASSMVFQTMAYLLEARRFMAIQNATGNVGEVVLAGDSHSFMLSAGRSHALRRWCRLLCIERHEVSGVLLPDQYTLREDDVVHDYDEQSLGNSKSARVTYSFAPNGQEGANGVFQLLSVIRPSSSV
ncbi:hypothetical protein PINS_up010208 [Pythium insidiosum]|nr:hypothetical protein PINS_up010208 [Pythium insidiosum]